MFIAIFSGFPKNSFSSLKYDLEEVQLNVFWVSRDILHQITFYRSE